MRDTDGTGKRARRIAIGAVAAGLLAVATTPAGAAAPRLDARAGERAPVPDSVRAARAALADRLGGEAHVATDPVGGGIRVLNRTDGFLSGPRAGDPAAVALDYVRARPDVFGLDAGDLAALRLVARTTSHDRVTHLTWVPASDGIPSYDGALRVHVTDDGRVLAASGPPLGGVRLDAEAPALTASQALAVARAGVGAPAGLPRADSRPGPQRVTAFANGDSARLVAFEAPGGDRLAWRVTLAGRDPYVYDAVVDAASGELLARRSLTDFASNAPVFPYNPAASGGVATTVDLAGWLTAPVVLSGPNAHAYADVDNDDVADAGEQVGPSSGTDWNWPVTFLRSICQFCTWDSTDLSSEATNRRHATTQLFYLVNAFHDWLEQPDVGFTNADGNFEGVDPVRAEADDSVLASGDDGPFFNNANMATFPDGTSPRMQMYLWRGAFPRVNGSDDASIVFHEYAHGLSNRLIGNAGGLSQNQGGAMGEGWSDWYAMDYLVANGFVSDTAADGEVAVGEYATGNAVRGIRTQPLDCAVGSAAPACDGTAIAGSGGYTFADLGRVGGWDVATPAFEVHDDGEIWAETLWDLRTALGGSTARRLITEGMRLSPVEPTFLDARDAILLADQALAGGAHRDAIWQVFATRGMGYGARTTGPNATRGIASFAPPGLAAVASVVASDPAPGGDADGVLEPGDRLRLSVALTAPGPATLTNAHATLVSATPGVTVAAASAGYGTVAPGASASGDVPFAVDVPRAFACGERIVLQLHVVSDQGTADLPLALSSGAGRATFSSADVPKAIDNDAPASVSAVSALAVPAEAGPIDRLRVTVDVAHTYVGDLVARLTAPSGQTIVLLERPGLSDDGFGSARAWDGPIAFDDDAPAPIQQLARTGGTLSGAFAPDEPLAALAGQDGSGTWRLRITDEEPFDDGALFGWSLETDVPGCTLAPLPPSGGGSEGPAPPPATASPPAAAGASTVAAPTRVTRRATVGARGRFAFAFRAAPGLRGSVRFTIPRRGATRALAFGRRTFRVPASGRVRLAIVVRGRALATLRGRRTAVRAAIRLGGATFAGRLSLAARRPRG